MNKFNGRLDTVKRELVNWEINLRILSRLIHGGKGIKNREKILRDVGHMEKIYHMFN